MARKKGVRYWTKKCDVVFSKIVRSKGFCEKCGSSENLQTAHILSRTHLHTRFSFDNAICLCLRHHLYWAHKEPIEFAEWVTELKGTKTIESLRKQALNTEPMDLEATYRNLVEIYEDKK